MKLYLLALLFACAVLVIAATFKMLKRRANYKYGKNWVVRHLGHHENPYALGYYSSVAWVAIYALCFCIITYYYFTWPCN